MALATWTRGFQLWLALQPDQELGPAESRYLEAHQVPRIGPASLPLGTYHGATSLLQPPSSIIYLAIRLKARGSWRYQPPADHEVGWIALARGVLSAHEPSRRVGCSVRARDQAIDLPAQADTEFVLGSAAPHIA